MKEGDVYKWYYKNDAEYRRNNSSTAYWCMDNRCIVRNGELVDTYWDGVDLNRLSSNSSYLNPDKVDLEFICNVNDLEFIKEYQIEDYDKVYNLSYQKGCYKLFAIDKGAKVSNKALHAKYARLLEEAQYQKRSAEWDIERYTKLIEELEV
jgi:hypothetical protein